MDSRSLAALVALFVTSATHVMVGEVVRVEATQRRISLRPEGVEPRETTVGVADDARLLSRGRRVGLHELRPGERVTIWCLDDGPRHHARVVKVGTRPAAVPSPR